MRTHMPVSVSLPPDLFAAAEKRAAELGFKRATYIQQLILADLRRQKAEAGSGAPSGGLGLALTTFGAGRSSSHVTPGAGARQGKGGAKKAVKPVKAAAKKSPAKKAAAPVAKKKPKKAGRR